MTTYTIKASSTGIITKDNINNNNNNIITTDNFVKTYYQFTLNSDICSRKTVFHISTIFFMMHNVCHPIL